MKVSSQVWIGPDSELSTLPPPGDGGARFWHAACSYMWPEKTIARARDGDENRRPCRAAAEVRRASLWNWIERVWNYRSRTCFRRLFGLLPARAWPTHPLIRRAGRRRRNATKAVDAAEGWGQAQCDAVAYRPRVHVDTGDPCQDISPRDSHRLLQRRLLSHLTKS